MSVTCSEVHQTSLCNDVYLVAVLKSVSHDVLAGWLDLNGNVAEACHVNLAVEVSCIAADGSVLHLHEVILRDHAVTSGNCHEDVSERSSLVHLHHLEAVHYSLHCLDRVDLSHDDLSTETLGAHCNSLSAPAVTRHNDILACHDEVCGTVYSVPY